MATGGSEPSVPGVSHSVVPGVVKPKSYSAAAAQNARSGPRPRSQTGRKPVHTSEFINKIRSLGVKNAIKFDIDNTHSIDTISSAIADQIGPNQLASINRTYGYVKCYIFSTEAIEFLVSNGINVDGNFYFAEPFVKPATKVVISNVEPFIPHERLFEKLVQYGKPIPGSMHYINASIKHEALKHVLSHRRQVYMVLHNEYKDFNGPLIISFENRDYKVHVSTESMKCFKCGFENHSRKNCPLNSDSGSPPPPPPQEDRQDMNVDEANPPQNVDKPPQKNVTFENQNPVEHPPDATADPANLPLPATDNPSRPDANVDTANPLPQVAENHPQAPTVGTANPPLQVAASDNSTPPPQNLQVVENKGTSKLLAPESQENDKSDGVVLVPETQESEVGDSGNKNKLPLFTLGSSATSLSQMSDLDLEGYNSDAGSQASDDAAMEDISDVNVLKERISAEKNLLDEKSIKDFLDQIKTRKKHVQYCTKFCADSRKLYFSLHKYRMKFAGGDKNLNQRIVRLTAKVRKNARNSGIFF